MFWLTQELDPTRSPAVTAHQAETHGEIQETVGGLQQGRKPSVVNDLGAGAQTQTENNGVPPAATSGQYSNNHKAAGYAQAQDGVSSERPAYDNRTRSAINDSVDEVYAGRASYKRQLSQASDDPIGKKAYTPGVEMDKLPEYSYSYNTSSEPVNTDTNNTAGGDPAGDNTSDKPPSQPPVRPGFSTTNTGTFLSYR